MSQSTWMAILYAVYMTIAGVMAMAFLWGPYAR